MELDPVGAGVDGIALAGLCFFLRFFAFRESVLEVATTELLAVALDFAADLVFTGAFVASGEAVGLAEMALNDVALVAIGT